MYVIVCLKASLDKHWQFLSSPRFLLPATAFLIDVKFQRHAVTHREARVHGFSISRARRRRRRNWRESQSRACLLFVKLFAAPFRLRSSRVTSRYGRQCFFF